MEPRSRDPLQNTTLSHYRIHERLGGGGMGVVYRADDLRLGRPVAIKFLPPHWSESEIAKTRFMREARAASAIEHPNICTIYEIDQTRDGKLFIVMPFYSGESLKKKIARGPLPVDEAVDYFVQLLLGLGKAHQDGIVHRDIKPANLMVTTDGTVKIVDFGLAKLSGSRQLTEVGQALGTAEYMSPEQTRAEELDARSDLWSAGVVLFEMLTGHRPFRGPPPIAIEEIRSGEMPRLPSSAEGIPHRVESVLQRILSKNREHRFQSAAEVLTALGAGSAAAGDTSARTMAYRLPAADREPRRAPVIAAAIAGLLIVAAILGWLSLRGERAPPAPAQPSRMRIAVLAPESGRLGNGRADWPRLIQTSLAAQLTGVEEFGVIDPLTLNGLIESNLGTAQPTRGPRFYDLLSRTQVDLIIDGALFESAEDLRLVANLVEPDNGETLLSRTVTLDSDDDLLGIMGQLAAQLVEYLQIEALGKKRAEDLGPWVSPRKHKVEALRAFMQASEYIFRYEPGGAKYLRRALEIDPAFITARVWLVSGLVPAGDMDEAAEHLAHLETLEPSASPFEQTMIDWARSFFDGDLEEQARHLGIALGYSPENYILLANLGFVHEAMGDCEAALEALRSPIAAAWAYPPIYAVQGSCLVERGRFREARQNLERALEIPPVHPGVHGMLEALAIHAGDHQAAELHGARYAAGAGIEVPAEEIEDVGKTFFLAGVDSLGTGDHERAVTLLERAVRHRPDDALSHESLGEALFLSAALAGARDAFEKAIALDAGRAHSRLRLGRIAEQTGDPKGASDHYGAYLSLQPTGPQAEEVRQRLGGLESMVHPE